jgi:hypothetical protein
MISHIEFLVEEPSAEAALTEIVPTIIGEDITFRIHNHQSKTQLLGSLESRLRAYQKWLPEDWRIVVLVDEDRQDCQALKTRLEEIAQTTGFSTKSASPNAFRLLNRIVIEELEAWFFGDVEALCAAYPGVPPTIGERSGYRNPDQVPGGTWEALERVLQRAGYFRGGLAKIEAARMISSNMRPSRNRSRSFQVFRDGLIQMLES